MQTKVIWINRHGEYREHTLGQIVTRFYAADWFRRSIIECQGILSRDEAYNSKLTLLEIKNAFDTNGKLANFIYKPKQIEPEVCYLKDFFNNTTEEV